MSSSNISTMDLILSARNISKVYTIYRRPIDLLKAAIGLRVVGKKVQALVSIDFNMHRGEVVGILGRNGAGKSTLLKILTGVIHPTTGSLKIDGNITSILELGIGINPEYSGRQNARLGAIARGVTRDSLENTIEKIIDFSELGDFIDSPLKTYSSGMQARLLFSTAIHCCSDIAIIDEALAAGDALFQAKCLDFMKGLSRAGTSILFVSHSIDMVQQLCNRAMLLDNGRKICDGDVETVSSAYHAILARDRNRSISQVKDPIKRNHSTNKNTALPKNGKHESPHIQSLGITDSRGLETTDLISGETYTITISAFSPFDIKHAYVGFRVYLPSGLILFSTSNTMLEKNIYIPENRILMVSYGFSCDLQSGTYIIGCGLGSMNHFSANPTSSLITHDVIDRAETIQVSTRTVHGGYVNLRANFRGGHLK